MNILEEEHDRPPSPLPMQDGPGAPATSSTEIVPLTRGPPPKRRRHNCTFFAYSYPISWADGLPDEWNGDPADLKGYIDLDGVTEMEIKWEKPSSKTPANDGDDRGGPADDLEEIHLLEMTLGRLMEEEGDEDVLDGEEDAAEDVALDPEVGVDEEGVEVEPVPSDEDEGHDEDAGLDELDEVPDDGAERLRDVRTSVVDTVHAMRRDVIVALDRARAVSGRPLERASISLILDGDGHWELHHAAGFAGERSGPAALGDRLAGRRWPGWPRSLGPGVRC